MTIRERVKVLAKTEKSYSAFAKKVGISPTSLSSIVTKEKGSMNYDTVLNVLSAYPMVNPMWFLLGEGEMYLSDDESKELHSSGEMDDLIVKISIMLNEFTEKQIDSKDRMLDMQEKRISMLERLLKKHAPEIATDIGL